MGKGELKKRTSNKVVGNKVKFGTGTYKVTNVFGGRGGGAGRGGAGRGFSYENGWGDASGLAPISIFKLDFQRSLKSGILVRAPFIMSDWVSRVFRF